MTFAVAFWMVWTAVWMTIAVNTGTETEGDLFQRQLSSFLAFIGGCLFLVSLRRMKP